MKSLQDSTKNELYDQLFGSIENEFGIEMSSKIPHDERSYIIWSTDKAVIEREKKKKMAYLMKKYPHDDGANGPVIFLTFTEPKTSQGNDSDLRRDPGGPLCQPLDAAISKNRQKS